MTLDRSAFRIAAIYALFGFAWIVFSDDLVLAVAPDMKMLAQLGTWKGLAFVLVTACVIYLALGWRAGLTVGDTNRVAAGRGTWPLILIFVLLASAIVAVGLLGVAYQMSSEKAGMYLRLQAVADLKIRQIGDWLGERRGDAAMIASAPMLEQAFGRPGREPDALVRARMVRRFDDYSRTYGYQAVSLYDGGGKVVLAAGQIPAGNGVIVAATIRRALDTGQVQFTDLYRAGGRAAMAVVAPVRSAGRPLAVVLHIDPGRFLYPLVQSWPVPSRSAETLLFKVDADGVLFLNDLRHRPGTALRLRVPLAEREVLAVKRARGEVGGDGEVEGVDYRKVPAIGVVKAVPGTDWFMIAKIDKDEMYGQGGDQAGWIILVDTLVLIIAAAASVLVHQRREMRLTLAQQREQMERLETLRLLDAISEGSTDAIFVKDADGRYVFLNQATAHWLDRPREDIVGQDDHAFFAPEVVRQLQAKDRETMTSGRPLSYEATYLMPAGERTFLITKGPLRGTDGGVAGVFGIARDITERKRAEDAVRASEQRYRSLFDNMLNGFAYCRMIHEAGRPSDFVYLEVNPAFERLTGLHDVAGRRVSEVIPGIRASNPELFEIYGRVAETAVPERFETYLAPLDAWFLVTVYSPEHGYFVAVFDVVTERKRAEAALIESEARFSTVFRASPLGIGLSGLDDGRYLDVNEAFLDLFSLARTDVIGCTAEALGLWPDAGAQAGMAARLAAGGRLDNLELVFRRHDGQPGEALVSAETVELGGRRYMLAMIADISGLRAAETRAREREAILDAVFQTLPDLFFLMAGDGTIIDYRSRSDGDLYVPPGAFLGKRMQEVLPAEVAALFDDRMAAVRRQGGLVAFEYGLAMPGGARHFEARLAMPEDGAEFIAVVRDITREHQGRQALVESEERFMRALENIPDVVVIYDRDLRIRYINGATVRLTGRPVSDFIGRREEEIWPPEVYGIYLPALERARTTGAVQTLEAELVLPGGHRNLQITCVPLLDAQGEVYEVMGFTHDLTERKRAEREILELNADLEARVQERTAQLEAANKELETFVYSASHDLKAPLRGIDGYSRLLLADCADALSGECRQFVDNIRLGTEQMNQLIDDLLAYSRMERRALLDAPVDLAAVVAAVLAERQEDIRARGVQVVVDLPAAPVRADRDGLLFVLRNLVDNALKFSRDARPPVIEVGGRVEDDGTRQVIWIKDNGIGFDMKFHDRIFDIFQRLQRAEDYPGTGVGLAIVHKAMQRMKGRVWAEGEPGRGATFYLELPS